MEIVMIINERILMKELENLSTADQDIARVSVQKISEAKTRDNNNKIQYLYRAIITQCSMALFSTIIIIIKLMTLIGIVRVD